MSEQTDELLDDVPSIEIEDKQEVLERDVEDDTPLDESDPRSAIYKKVADQRLEEMGEAPPKEEAAVEPEADEEISVKVNGKERKVLRSKVEAAGGIDAYQKNAAASELLNQASAELRRVKDLEQQMLTQAQAREQRLKQQEQELQTRAQQPLVSPPVSVDAGAMKNMARKYHEAIMDGDVDKADELLVQMQVARSSATPDVDAIAKKAAATARAEIDRERQAEKERLLELNRQEGLKEYREQFAEIADDPELNNMADAKSAEIYRENPNWEPKAIIIEAAKRVQTWAQSKGLSQGGSDTRTDEKIAAKRQQTTIRGGTARAIPRAAPPPPTRSQYVESLRKQRGLE